MNARVMPAEATGERDIYTVSRLNREARVLLEQGLPALWLEGEISNFSQPSSGHWYFSLKDAQAQVRCAMFRQRNLLARCSPCNGLKVLVRARVSVYEPRGEYQLIVDDVEEAGEGELRRQFEVLKAKLQKEGLFAAERKRALPALPRRIGVVTSPTGAAIRDVLHILQRRFPTIPVLIYPVPVQGAGAGEQIAAAIRLASQRAECDVLIVGRGGGSLEDLWAFNEEVVARALAACQIATVTGIGHEVDFTIADFVADRRAPTPSAAAEIVVPDGAQFCEQMNVCLRRLTGALRRLLLNRQSRHQWMAGRLKQCHPGVRLRHQVQRLDDFEQRMRSAMLRRVDIQHRRQDVYVRLTNAMKKRLTIAGGRLDVAARALNTVSPLATLDRGYAIVTRVSDGAVLRSAEETKVGERIEARLHRGRVRAVVENKE